MASLAQPPQGWVEKFRRNGFVVVPSIVSEAEIAALAPIFADLFDRRAGRSEGAQRDMLGSDEDSSPVVQPEIIDPSNYSAELRRSRLRSRAAELARELLGQSAVPSFEHAIMKPPGSERSTPWHQDEAFRPDGSLDYEQLSIWVPLQDVDQDNGCMRYVPGSHLGAVLDHRPAGGDPRLHALEYANEAFEPTDAVACPLRVGGAVIHHGRTLHGAFGNSGADPRYAYVMAFRIPAAEDARRHDFPWQRRPDTAPLRRRRSWLRRGGVVVDAYRRARRRLERRS